MTEATGTTKPEVVIPTMPANTFAYLAQFTFKRKKLRDEQGNVVLDEAGKEKVEAENRKPLELYLPVPTHDALNAMAVGSKEWDLVQDAMADYVYRAAKEQVDGDDNISQDTLDLSKLDWSFIANLPKAERTGGGIPASVWEEFEKDYIDVCINKLGHDAAKVPMQAALFVDRLNKVKTNKPVIAKMQEALAGWFGATDKAEDFIKVFEYLDKKATDLLEADETALLAKLGF